MKNIDAPAKFSFKKTTVTVFNKQTAIQGKQSDDEATTTNTQGGTTVIVTSYWTGLLAI